MKKNNMCLINKKGFTLIELLAVIVVLGIVSVIATTLVVRYMSNARIDAFAVEASNVISGAKNAVSMNDLNKLEIENDDNSCKVENRMCFTIDTLIELGVFKGNKEVYDGKVNIDISDKQNLKYKLFLEKKNEFNIIGSNVIDYSKNKDAINKGNFSGEEIEEYTICSCVEDKTKPVIEKFYIENENQEYLTKKDTKIYISWLDEDVSHYCVTDINNSISCNWIETNGNNIEMDYIFDNDGEKKLYAFIKDKNRNISDSVEDIIILDSKAPKVIADSLNNNTISPQITFISDEGGEYCVNTSSTDMSTCIYSGIVTKNEEIVKDITESNEYYVHVKEQYGNIGVSNSVNIVKLICNPNTLFAECLKSAKTRGFNSNMDSGLYRYQGERDLVNNYLCFGTSNKDTCLNDPRYSIYRIIGIAANDKIKVIKNYPLLDTMQWNSDDRSTNIIWPNSDLYKAINGTSYLTNISYIPSGWEEKIETTTWKYGDISVVNMTAKELYDIENAWSSTTNAKIGLMYAHDYYYAYQSGGLNCHQSVTDKCENSWIVLNDDQFFQPLPSEWLMSRYGYYTLFDYYAPWLAGYGTLDSSYDMTWSFSVRPVFFLTSSIKYISGSGTASDPFIIS